MVLQTLGAYVLFAPAFIGGSTAPSSQSVAPRFSLGAATAMWDDHVALRVERTPSLPRQEFRLYLVPADVSRSVRSRFDSRLIFIGSVRASRHAQRVFTVPPLQAGKYALAYWCRGCLSGGKGIGVQASPKLRVETPIGEGCPATKPNGNVTPAMKASWPGFQWHGNDELWALLRPDGLVVTNALGGYKMLWAAKDGVSGPLRVQYRPLDPPSAPVTARAGTLSGYDRPNATMSQMSFQPGCWYVAARLLDVSLSFVVRVVLGDS